MTLDDIYPFVQIEAPGCPIPVVRSAALLTLRDFLRETRAWRTTLTPVEWANPLVLTLPAGSELSITHKVYDRLQRCEIDFFTAEQLRGETDVTWREPGPNPIVWTLEDGKAPVLYPAPAGTAVTADRLDVTVVLNAARDAATAAIPDWLWEKYEEAFIFGTLARVLRIPGRDWTNPQQAMAYGTGYQSWKQQAKSEATADFGRPTRVVRYGGY